MEGTTIKSDSTARQSDSPTQKLFSWEETARQTADVYRSLL